MKAGRHLCCIEDFGNPAQDGIIFALILLADELNVTEFAEVEIPLLLQSIHCQFEVH